MASNLPVVSPSLIKWKPVFIEKFDLGIGEEWLPRVGLTDDGTANSSDKLTDTASDVIEWLFNESCDEVTDVTEWLSSLPDHRYLLSMARCGIHYGC